MATWFISSDRNLTQRRSNIYASALRVSNDVWIGSGLQQCLQSDDHFPSRCVPLAGNTLNYTLAIMFCVVAAGASSHVFWSIIDAGARHYGFPAMGRDAFWELFMTSSEYLLGMIIIINYSHPSGCTCGLWYRLCQGVLVVGSTPIFAALGIGLYALVRGMWKSVGSGLYWPHGLQEGGEGRPEETPTPVVLEAAPTDETDGETVAAQMAMGGEEPID